jgi:TPR repeat protein
MIASSDRDTDRQGKRDNRQGDCARTGEVSMARLEMPEPAMAGLGEAPAAADTIFELGMMYSSGRSVPIDLVIAHKWFNIAAMKGHAEAARLRREIAAEMSDAQIGQAQRAARDWLKAHPVPAAPQPVALRAAA